MKKKVLLIDTCILTVWLQIPGFEQTNNKHLDKAAIDEVLEQKKKEGYSFILPIATIIETGNHVAQISDGNDRYRIVNAFADLLIDISDGNRKPWMLNRNEDKFYTQEELKTLANQWKKCGIYRLSLGDASILKVANSLKPLCDVEVFTDDEQLEQLAMVPPTPTYVPRRKKG